MAPPLPTQAPSALPAISKVSPEEPALVEELESAAAPVYVMPAGLTFDDKIVWQIRHGEHRQFYIAPAIGEYQGEVNGRLHTLGSRGKVVERTVNYQTQYFLVEEKAA